VKIFRVKIVSKLHTSDVHYYLRVPAKPVHDSGVMPVQHSAWMAAFRLPEFITYDNYNLSDVVDFKNLG
jgi:hypothetical protein